MESEIVFALIGSVDAGKSTCAGRLLWDSGAVSDHEVEVIRKNCENTKMASWYLARLLDVYDEERRRG